MKTIYHSHLRGSNGCLGFYFGLNALKSDYPEGGLAGEFFVNGETQSIWIWDVTTQEWCNTNHATTAPFMGVINNPETFSPSLNENTPGCFIYVVGQQGIYNFPLLSGSDSVSVDADKAGIITLIWNGQVWSSEFTPLSFDNTGSPVAIYRGEWDDSETYQCGNGFADVVYYNEKYYRLKSLVEQASTNAPDVSDEWEELSHYAAIANELQLTPNGTIPITGNQKIEINQDGKSWTLENGAITHTPTGNQLSQSGDLVIKIGDKTDLCLSQQEQGFTITTQGTGNSPLYRCRIIEDGSGNGLIQIHKKNSTDTYTTTIMPQGIEVYHKGKSNYTLYISEQEILCRRLYNGQNIDIFKLTNDRTKLQLKHISDDTIEPGDLYYDDDYYVYYCE